MRRLLPLIAVTLLVSCGEDPPPAGGLPDAGPPVQIDVGVIVQDTGVADDSGVHPDAMLADAGPTGDTGPADAADPDASPVDASADAGSDAGADTGADASTDGGSDAATDAGPDGGADAGLDGGADAGMDVGTDTGVDAGPPDSGILLDGDNDGIADIHEGNGLVDTDLDGVPDSLDADSDNDGIPDSVEAGDTDVNTPPIDTNNNGLPDFLDTDSDGDGIDDILETAIDTDLDGVPNYLDSDSDGDQIADLHEGALDPDGDGVPNYLDPDSDGDGIDDAIEAGDQLISSPPRDNDFDGIPNFLDADSDNDFISDLVEGAVDSDGDTIPDFIDIDSDNDSVLDRFEAGDQDLLTPPTNTGGSPLPDYLDLDSDGDTIGDVQEGTVDTDGNGVADRLSADSDGDGWSDSVEAGDSDLATLPIDTDLDGTPDFRDLDSDADGLTDATELGCPAGSSRLLADTDADTFDDLAEAGFGSDPCDNLDLIDDFYFVLPPNGPGGNAPLSFTDTQIDRADLAINIDTTGSMGGEMVNLQSSLSTTIIPQIGAVIPDAAFAVTSFEDFPVLPFGFDGANDLPFRLGTRVTTNSQTAQAAVNALQIRSGNDLPESGLEALYQITTGAGATWPGFSVPAFNNNVGLVPGVADGTIGGVGFRTDSLPVILHITDALSNSARDYVGQNFSTPATPVVEQAISGVGARVVTISSGPYEPANDLLCAGRISTFFGGVTPRGADVDWFLIQGAVAGDTVDVDVSGSSDFKTLNPLIAVANATSLIATNDDRQSGDKNSELSTVALTGTGPFYVAVASTGDTNFNGAGGTSDGYYFINVAVNGAAFFPGITACRLEDADSRVGATILVTGALANAPIDQAQCRLDCETFLGDLDPTFQNFTYPYEMAQDTGAIIPPCAWSFFGSSRPAGCSISQCCTDVGGAGRAPDATGNCPLAFKINSNGSGLGTAAVAGVEALVNFAAFTVTTAVRPDPVQLANGLDTTCFIHGVVPQSATPPNTCAPNPVAVDLLPPVGLDSWQDVVPGTVLDFQVNALNEQIGGTTACVPSTLVPQQFTAFIDVVADGVTVLATRRVIIIVPPTVPGTSN